MENSRPREATYTAVALEHCPERRNVRLIFGTPRYIQDDIQTHALTRRTAYFQAGSIFAVDAWEGGSIADRQGTVRTRTRHRACYILRSAFPGEILTRVPNVTPGARILVHTEGVRRCKFLLAWLEELEKRCDPCSLESEWYEAKSLRVLGLVPERNHPSAIGFPTIVPAC